MKYLLKLDRHIEVIRDVFDGLITIVDFDGNELEITDIPDYVLEVNKPFYYLYPKYFGMYKEDFNIIICEHCNLEYIIKQILYDENVEVLGIKNYSEGKRYKKRKVMV